MKIERCVCCDRTFTELAQAARGTGAREIEELQAHIDFGTGCGLCLPYVRRMLRTGEVIFFEILHDEDEPPAPKR